MKIAIGRLRGLGALGVLVGTRGLGRSRYLHEVFSSRRSLCSMTVRFDSRVLSGFVSQGNVSGLDTLAIRGLGHLAPRLAVLAVETDVLGAGLGLVTGVLLAGVGDTGVPLTAGGVGVATSGLVGVETGGLIGLTLISVLVWEVVWL